MDENKTDTENDGQGEEPAENAGHWNSLAELLGAEVEEQPAAPEVKAPAPATPAAPAKKTRKEPTPAAQPPKSHWQTLAGMLGIGGGQSEPEAPATIESAESDVAAPPSNSPRELEKTKSAFGSTTQTPPSTPAPPKKGAPEVAAPPQKKSFWGRRQESKSTKQADEPKKPSRRAEQPAKTESAPQAKDSKRTAAKTEKGSDSDAAPEAGGFGFGLPGFGSDPQPVAEDTSTPPVNNLAETLGTSYEPDETDLRQAEAKSVLDSLFVPSEEPFWEEEDDDEEVVSQDDDHDFGDDDYNTGDEYAEEDETADFGDDESRGSGTPQATEEPERSGHRGRRRRRRSAPQGNDTQGESSQPAAQTTGEESTDSGSDSDSEGRGRSRGRGRGRSGRGRGRGRGRSDRDSGARETGAETEGRAKPESSDTGEGRGSAPRGGRSEEAAPSDSGSGSDGTRRRRRRRRGGRNSEGATSEARPRREANRDENYDSSDVIEDPVGSPSDGDPSDSVLRLEASADLFDEPQTESARSDGPDGEGSPQDGARRKSSIPSWQEAVGVIVKRNIGTRSGSGKSGSGDSRRRRGGRRRKPNSGRQSNQGNS